MYYKIFIFGIIDICILNLLQEDARPGSFIAFFVNITLKEHL